MKRIFTLFLLLPAFSSFAQQFTAGNVALFVAMDGNSKNTGFKIVEINNTTANQSSVVIHPVDSTGANALRTSGSASSTGYLSNSNDGTLLCFTAHNTVSTSTTVSNINTVTARGVGTFTNAGTYQLQTTYTGVSGEQTRSASTVNNASWLIGDQEGLYRNTGTGPTDSANLRSVKVYGGNTYVFQGSAPAIPVTNLIQVNSKDSLHPQSGLSPLVTSDFQDFALVSSQNNGSYDVLYVLEDTTTTTVGIIYKYSWVGSIASGTWVANGSYRTSFGGFGMAALEKTGGGADLYISSGTGATLGNSVYKITDIAGLNATMNVNTASNINLYTVTSPNTIKGVAFAPKISAGLPITLTSFNASLVNGTVQLWWNTANEVNASSFEVERSSDATQFTAIGTVAANNAPSSYSYTDQQPLNGASYYRLKLVDKDGSFKYSDVISINNLAATATHLSVYPNPVTSTFTLTHDKAVNGAVIRIITIDGKTIFTQSIATGATQSTVDASKLISGNYLVVFDNNGNRSVTQFIK